MASATFTSSQGTSGPGVLYQDGATMGYGASFGAFCVAVELGTPQYEIMPVYAPGADGGGTKNYGFRSQIITLRVEYLDSGEDGVVTAINGDMATLSQTPNDLTIGSNSWGACLLQSFVAEQPKKITSTSSDYRAKAMLTVRAVQLI